MIGASRMALNRGHQPTHGWLAEAPRGWPVLRLRYCAAINPSRSEVNGLRDDTEVSFVPMEAVCEYGGLHLDQTRSLADVATGYTYFREGDIVVAKITPCFENGKGSIAEGLTNGLGFGTTELHVLRPLAPLDRTFLFYLTISHPFRSIGTAYMYGAGGQKRVPDDFVRDFRHPIPPLGDQRAIVAFLNRETARIEALSEKKRWQIELLQEKRAALISHAVTKGLDPKAPMKDSGIDWIGPIPSHWTVARVKHVARLESGHTPSRSIPEHWLDANDIPWVSLNDTKWLAENDWITDTAYNINALGLQNSSARLLPARVVVFTRDATIGKAAITTRSMAVSQHLIAWVCGPKLLPEYLLRVFYAMEPALERYTFGATIKTIGMDDVRALVTPLPPLEDQLRIVHWIGPRVERIAAAVRKVEVSIDRLREYRTALISAAVTGKIDVRKEVA